LKIRELTFEAAHYLANHPTCGCIHGHTYFVRDIEVFYDESKFVDFALIKAVPRILDHKFLVPEHHAMEWYGIIKRLGNLGISQNIIEIPGGNPTVENISDFLKARFLSIPNVIDVCFELYEGPNLGICEIPNVDEKYRPDIDAEKPMPTG